MQVRIQTSGFDLTPAIAAWAHERIAGALDRFAEDVVAADVYLKDVNGPKGGMDKEASVRIRQRFGAAIYAEALSDDMYAAIDLLSRRARRCVRRARRKRRAVRGVARLRPVPAIGAESG